LLWAFIALGAVGAGGGWYYFYMMNAEGEPALASSDKPSTPRTQANDASAKTKAGEKPASLANAAEPASTGVVADGGKPAGAGKPTDGSGKSDPDEDKKSQDPSDRLRNMFGSPGTEKTAGKAAKQPAVDAGSEKAKSADGQLASAESEAAPLPAVASADEIQRLAAACREFSFKPNTREQYAQLASLSGLLHAAGDAAAEEAAANVFRNQLAPVTWSPQEAQAVNRYLSDQLQEQKQGVFGIGEVVGYMPNALVLRIFGGQELLKLAPIGGLTGGAEKFPPGTQWIIIGVTTDENLKLKDPIAKEKEPQASAVVESNFLLTTKIVKQQEKFGPAPQL